MQEWACIVLSEGEKYEVWIRCRCEKTAKIQ